MMRGMYAAISGLKSHQTMLDVTANDISNVNTIGYKSARTTFQDSLAQMQRAASATTALNGGTNAVQVGLGTSLGSVDNLMGQGSQQSTGNALDVTISGDGFFQLAEGAPTAGGDALTPSRYTRAGNFTLNVNGFLTAQDGKYVIGNTTSPASTTSSAIKIPTGATAVSIDQNGGVSYIDPTTKLRVSPYRLQLAGFANSAGLERMGGNQWAQSANSGTPVKDTPGNSGLGTTYSGQLEMSNVDLATTFTQLITAQRGFQANSRVISTADEMLQDVVNLKR